MTIDDRQGEDAESEHFGQEFEMDDTPRRIPAIQGWSARLHKQSISSFPIGSEQTTATLPQHSDMPLRESAQPHPAAASNRAATEMQDQGRQNHIKARRKMAKVPTQPLPTPSAQSWRRKRRRRLAAPILLTLALLALLIGMAGLFGYSRWYGATGAAGNAATATTGSIPAGNVLSLPLSAQQINDLRHLSKYMQYKQLASMYVARMSLDVELGQLIMVEYADTYYSPDLDTMVNKLHAGGVIMYEFQMQSFNQTKHDIAEMQQRATFPLLISADEEGGIVHRLLNIYPPRMSATDIANTGDPDVATQQANLVAHQLLALGINENLAPDVDVNLINGYDMIDRTFGNTPQGVIRFAAPYIQALQRDGVVACLKHFPGLGDALTDAHTGLPVVNRTKQQLYDVELSTFKYFIQSQNKLDNPGMIMPTDVLMPAIDPVYPAELSHIFMTDILRKQFGYDGVALTDALYMQGITQKWSMPQAAVMALNAGNDMLLGPTGADQMVAMLDAIKQALKDGTLSKARVDEAATRIIALKMAYHLLPAAPPQN